MPDRTELTPVPKSPADQINTKATLLANLVNKFLLDSQNQAFDGHPTIRHFMKKRRDQLDRDFDEIRAIPDDIRAAVIETNLEKMHDLEIKYLQYIPGDPNQWDLNDIYQQLGREGLQAALTVCFSDRNLQPKVSDFMTGLLK